jgi:hypothetical protein
MLLDAFSRLQVACFRPRVLRLLASSFFGSLSFHVSHLRWVGGKFKRTLTNGRISGESLDEQEV